MTATDDATFPPGTRIWRVLYVSTGRDNRERTLVCGVVAAPDHPTKLTVANAGGLRTGRVVAWAHGTLGLVQRCQPSTQPAAGIWGPPPFGINAVAWGSDAHNDRHEGSSDSGILAGMISAGWIVTATDYYADLWGGTTLEPFALGKIEAANVLDLVRAAHHLLAQVYADVALTAYDVVSWGHSQGGHAAL